MKETSYNVVLAEAKILIEADEWQITNYVSVDVAAIIVANVYWMADLVSGFGQDIPNTISVISNNSRISVIADGAASFYKHDGRICEYEDLQNDIGEILIVLETAIQRMISRS